MTLHQKKETCSSSLFFLWGNANPVPLRRVKETKRLKVKETKSQRDEEAKRLRVKETKRLRVKESKSQRVKETKRGREEETEGEGRKAKEPFFETLMFMN